MLIQHTPDGHALSPLFHDYIDIQLLYVMATASIRPKSTNNTLSLRRGGGKDGLPKPNNVILLDALGSGTYATVYKGILKV